ncbi:cell division protein ZipA [uncultured Paraglaciecola sp.]|uniref:cell division protein ZipA n=1 Tax=uncultured Paraglaciecola sp. TaxID=1765024 RepID=UPI00259AC0E1|nr:cell division protein ZipA [uncultured Paraglaciecola sp.]
MEDVLRWSLLVVGSCVIIGVAVHGIWVSRKNSEQKLQKTRTRPELQTEDQYPVNDMAEKDVDVSINFDNDFNEPSVELEDEITSTSTVSSPKFDDLGLSSVRVVSGNTTTEPDEATEIKHQGFPSIANTEVENQKECKAEKQPNESPSKIYASVVTQPKPEYTKQSHVSKSQNSDLSQQHKLVSSSTTGNPKPSVSSGTSQSSTNSISDGYQAPEPPPFLLKKDASHESETTKDIQKATSRTDDKPLLKDTKSVSSEKSVSEKPSLSEQARNLVKRKKSENTRKRREPKIAEDQMKIDFDVEDTKDVTQPQAIEPEKKSKTKPAKVEQEQEVLVLNVKTPDGDPISGAALLPMLLTLGFKFGDQDIFHRHVNSNGKGPVLFSLANMFKPGVFDIDNLENFTTQGVSLFMILPIEGEPHQVFNMMHNAARKISEEFSAQIYDAKRSLLTKQSLQQYVEKIREFERQRMLKNG